MAATREGPIERRPDWRDPASYAYTHDLTREGWAWEFLRRNPNYRRAWNEHAGNGAITIRSPAGNARVIEAPLASLSEQQTWGLTAFEDPARTAAVAHVFWSPEASSSVLRVHAVPVSGQGDAHAFDGSGLRCRMVLLDSSGAEQHVLFCDGARRLQIAVAGANVRGGACLLASAVIARRLLESRFQLLRRLSDLAETGHLAPRLYPSDPRCQRLCRILQMLDGEIDGASQRDIAIALFGDRRAYADWSDTLRDRIRRALRRARWLMNRGYFVLLR